MSLPLTAVAFLLGILSLQLFSHLPAPGWLWLLPPVLFLAWRVRGLWLKMTLIAVAGGLWALMAAQQYAARVLPESRAGEVMWIEGEVVDIPQRDGHIQRFQLQVPGLPGQTRPRAMRLRLSWYSAPLTPAAGERWRLQVKLKPPHGFMNPGGFDYQKWLFQQGVHATGYVRQNQNNQRLASAAWFSVDALRQGLAEKLLARDSTFRGFWAALAVGHRAAISRQHWDVLIATGTNHLMAISGLHIGLVAGLAFWLLRRSLPARLIGRFSADQLAAAMGLLLAAAYALLAGFAIPTQRALVMLLVVLGAVLAKRPLRPANGLSTALLLVLVLDPVAVLSAGFWFSFLAVAAIAYGFAGRLGRPPLLLQWGRLQWVIAVMLFPLSLFLFQQGSLVAPLANLLLVPWVSFLVVPPVLLSLVFMAFSPGLAELLLQLAHGALALVWPLIGWLADLPLASWHQAAPSPLMLLLAMLGVMLLLAPRGLPARWLGLLLLLPALLTRPAIPQQGAFSMTLLDVGQGLSVFLQTRAHRLLFDTGARYSDNFDLGDRVVLPYLRSRGLDSLDMLIISHGDNDHKGGARSILQNMAVKRLLGQDIDDLPHGNKALCGAGQAWRWDGVDFTVLHPDRVYDDRNNRGCVLRVSNDAFSVLLAADIEKPVEQYLLDSQPGLLSADVLVVAHHGSKTSSSEAWIDAVAPRYALVSAGYRSRFGHPAAEVQGRYQRRGIPLLNTANQGAIHLDFAATGRIVLPQSYREQQRRYWHDWPLR